jgi:hypothetical protein
VIDGSYVPDLPGKRPLNGAFDQQPERRGLLHQHLNPNDTAFTTLVQSLIPDASAETIAYVSTVLYPPIFNSSYPWTTQFERGAQITEEFTIICNSYFLANAFAPDKAWKYLFAFPPALHGDDIRYTFFNGDTSTPNLGGGTINATVAGVLQGYIVTFVESGKPGGKGNVLDLNAKELGSVLVDADDNSRCKYWQEAAWM